MHKPLGEIIFIGSIFVDSEIKLQKCYGAVDIKVVVVTVEKFLYSDFGCQNVIAQSCSVSDIDVEVYTLEVGVDGVSTRRDADRVVGVRQRGIDIGGIWIHVSVRNQRCRRLRHGVGQSMRSLTANWIVAPEILLEEVVDGSVRGRWPPEVGSVIRLCEFGIDPSRR